MSAPTGNRSTVAARSLRVGGVVGSCFAAVTLLRIAEFGCDHAVMRVGDLLRRGGVRGVHLHAASLASVGLCIGLWVRAKTVDQDERGNAERRALFVGLWPSTLWLIGDAVDRCE